MGDPYRIYEALERNSKPRTPSPKPQRFSKSGIFKFGVYLGFWGLPLGFGICLRGLGFTFGVCPGIWHSPSGFGAYLEVWGLPWGLGFAIGVCLWDLPLGFLPPNESPKLQMQTPNSIPTADVHFANPEPQTPYLERMDTFQTPKEN